MNLFEKSLHTLEFPKVLSQVAQKAQTQKGKEKILALLPFTHLDDMEEAQEETATAVSLLLAKGSPSFSGAIDVGQSLSRAQLGGSLNPRELLDIASLLRATNRAYDYGDGMDKNALAHLFHSLCPQKFLEETISTSLLSETEVADSASSELASIRRKIRGTEAKARDILQKLLTSSQAQYLQEPIITTRSGRFVVPVKSEHKNAIPGMVHDVSSSGSSFFIEPMAVVNAGNELRELVAKEEKEIARILADLSAQCAQVEDEICQNYFLLTLLDVAFAKGHYALAQGGMKPKFSRKHMHLERARHPLLDAKTAVANDLSLGEGFDTLMITGPNTGGKTVTLKTVGLLTAMAQTGLHIPVGEESVVRIFHQILADIGDEQSIAQSLSTFSSHLRNIVQILEVTDENTLVLFDELGAGTDPSEGGALAMAIITHCRQLSAHVLATTHYPELKLFALSTPGVENASCEFDVETLAPTYRLQLGIPGKSNAFAISRRLGLAESILDKASQHLSSDTLRFEDVLHELEEKRQELAQNKAEMEELKRKAKAHEENARGHKERLERQLEHSREKARKEADAILQEARDASDLVFQELKDLKKKQKKQENWQEVNDGRAGIRQVLNQAQDKNQSNQKPKSLPPTRPAQVGDVVELISMGTRATVLEVSNGGQLKLEAGILKITAKQKEVRVLEGVSAPKPPPVKKATRTLNLKPTAREIDLRGMESLEALAVTEQFLDSAVLAKLETVCIIHGKGTGALKKAIRSYLKTSRYAKSYRPGLFGEGEDGVTVVELR